MKPEKFDPKPLIITEGYYSDQQYDGYEMLAQSTKNWKQLCPYQLQPGGVSGRHRVLQLHTMQIVFAERKGGTMHNAVSAKDSISIAVNEICVDKVCFGRIKIETGNILFFDDSKLYNFITNDTIKFAVITIQKSNLGSRLPKLSRVLDQCIKDTDACLTALLHRILKRFTDSPGLRKDTQSCQEAENEILSAIMGLLAEQTPVVPKLTVGETKALDIRDQFFGHMDGKIDIASLAKQYQVSDQTLQNSFKSLFGYAPKRFFLLLKLNMAHYDLMENSPDQSSVSKIALKWGFTHMGRFSGYYTELFGENPSQTLKSPCCQETNNAESCVVRQEEMV
jgi:AraC-like DNA-binding protein